MLVVFFVVVLKAAAFDKNFTTQIFVYVAGKIVSDYEYQDLVKNHQYSTTTSVTGEDVIRNFKPK